MMMASDDKMKIEKDEQQMPKGELDFDRMAQHVQNFFKFKNFYDQMDFNAHLCLVITEAIIQLTDSV